MSGFTIDIPVGGELHKSVLKALNARFRLSANKMSSLHTKWRKREESFLAYLPERDVDALRRAEREQGGKPQYTTIVLPYTYANVMSAHSYWCSVFLGRDPIFQYKGRHGEGEQQTQAVEALIDYQVQNSAMITSIIFWLMDAGKYGLGILGGYWDKKVHHISEFQETPLTDQFGVPIEGKTQKGLVSREVKGYEGNCLFNIRPYDYFPDPRVPLHSPQKGEFVGYLSDVSWNDIARSVAYGGMIEGNAKYLKQKGFGSGVSGRTPGTSQMELPAETGDAVPLDVDLSDTGPYTLLTMNVDIIPKQWGLSPSTYPEKWVFVAATQGQHAAANAEGSALEVILSARPLGALNNEYPINVIEMEPEAYGLASRALSDIIAPIQNTLDWLVNSHMYNVRKTLNNQFVVDPSRIVMGDFADPMAGGAIRLKSSAYGTDTKTALSQLGVVDLTRGHFGDMGALDQIGQKATGINEQVMGMLNMGGRKTAQEIRTSSTFGVNRLSTISMMMSAMGFVPLGRQLIQNSQQYFDSALKVRIVGDLVQEAGPQFVNVTPESIAGFYDLVPVDGTMPLDRYAQANLWQQMLGTMSKVPQVMMRYDLGRIFGWVAQLAGLKNINQFQVQLGDPAQLAAQAQAGNVVPMKAPVGAGVVRDPGQVPGMGTSG